MAFRSGSLVQQVIAFDDLCIRIRQERKRVAGFFAKPGGGLRRVHGNRYGTDARRFILFQVFLYAS